MTKFDDRIRGVVAKIASTERERLNDAFADRPWWGDAVFLMHDLRTLCTLMKARDVDDGADALSEVIAKSSFQLLISAGNYEPPVVMNIMTEMLNASEELDKKMDEAALHLRVEIAAEDLGFHDDL